MSVDITSARKELKTLVNQMRNLIQLDEELERVGSLDHFIAAKEASLNRLEKQIAASESEFSAMEAKIEAERQAMEKERIAHQAQLGEAKREAESIKARARDEAMGIIKEATEKARGIADNAKVGKDIMEKRVADLRERMKQLQSEVDEAEKRRDAINDELARVRQLMTGE
jgi:DNA repair protein SbcC/Rad50